jgi:hypothetical protein
MHSYLIFNSPAQTKFTLLDQAPAHHCSFSGLQQQAESGSICSGPLWLGHSSFTHCSSLKLIGQPGPFDKISHVVFQIKHLVILPCFPNQKTHVQL